MKTEVKTLNEKAGKTTIILIITLLLVISFTSCTEQSQTENTTKIKILETYVDCELNVVCFGTHDEENWMVCDNIDKQLENKLC